jgi:predicted AAA+ superfamily ATPase
MTDYQRRIVDNELNELLQELPAIAIEGPRGVGKTSTAERRAATVLHLDDPAVRAMAELDPGRALAVPGPILIDEWQQVPATWDTVRRAVDRDRSAAQFLLTGSASPKTPPTHSGAGRIVTLRMRPLTLVERGIESPTVNLRQLLSGAAHDVAGSTAVTVADYVHEIVASGLPAVRTLSARSRRAQLDGYLRRIIDTDFQEQGISVRRPAVLERWLGAYAAATATTASFETIRDAATAGSSDKPAKTTTLPYRDALERLWIIDPIPAWLPTRNRINRLAQPPKHHLADPALATRLLGLDADALLRGTEAGPHVRRDGPLLGHLFESLVTLCVRVYAQAAEARVSHLRLHGGRQEVDLIVERSDQRVLGIEVKLSRTITDHDVRHLVWLKAQLGDELLDALVVYAGQHAYRRPDGIAVVPAALLGP